MLCYDIDVENATQTACNVASNYFLLKFFF